MKILSFETSCDETAVAVTEDGRRVLSDAIASQVPVHALYGGVVPEIASRSHVEVIYQLADRAIAEAGIAKSEIDAVAVSYAPGLIGAVLVGVSFAKSAAAALGVPLIPVHHIRGHMAANYLAYPELEPPFVCLAISGGNTLIVDVRGYTDMRILGATPDDLKAVSDFHTDYPGGKPVYETAKGGNDSAFSFPVAHVEGRPYDMSFSGLKTAVVNLVHHAEQTGEALNKSDVCASFQRAVSASLVPRAIAAVRACGYNKLVAAGGVAANSRIRADLEAAAKEAGIALYVPPLRLCGDNGAMVGAQGYYEFLARHTAGNDLNAYASLTLDQINAGS